MTVTKLVSRNTTNSLKIATHVIELSVYVLLSTLIAVQVVNLVYDQPVEFVWLIAEDSYGDYFTVLNYVLAGGLLIAFSSKRDLRWQRWIWRLLGVFCFFVAAEEISWGQRIFIVATPDWIKEVNVQNEITIHNLDVLEPIHSRSHEYLSYLILAWLAVSVSWAMLKPLLKIERESIFFLLFCPLKLVPIFLLVPYFFLFNRIVRADEVVEIVFSLALLTYVIDLFFRYSLRKERSPFFCLTTTLGVASTLLSLSVVLTYWHAASSVHHATLIQRFMEHTEAAYRSVGMDEQAEKIQTYMVNSS